MSQAYVGAVPTTGDFKKLDSITTSSATTFNLRQGGVAVYPQSANHCIVSLNGVIQAPGDAFNIVNDTVVFSSSLASSDVINFFLVLGNVNDIGTVSDDTVSTAKLQANAVTAAKFNADVISGQTALGAEPSDTDEFLVSDGGVIKRVDYSHIKGDNNAPSFCAYGGTQNSVADNTTTVLTCSSEVFDSDGKYDTSNYRFTPGVTGKYFFHVGFKNNQTSARLQCGIFKNGSLISEANGRMEPENNGHGSNTYTGVSGSIISICDNTSDYFQAFGWQKSGSTETFYNPRFLGFRIAGTS